MSFPTLINQQQQELFSCGLACPALLRNLFIKTENLRNIVLKSGIVAIGKYFTVYCTRTQQINLFLGGKEEVFTKKFVLVFVSERFVIKNKNSFVSVIKKTKTFVDTFWTTL